MAFSRERCFSLICSVEITLRLRSASRASSCWIARNRSFLCRERLEHLRHFGQHSELVVQPLDISDLYSQALDALSKNQ
jgi:hypothetical protein